ncbi:MAG TPA: MgtC/SapB family protein [Anaerolineales bacterium]|nr:MgtC/SapB family protein [Anaerolineae bacterium]HIP87228.1 MgtC/SapB family protein [Anaerolineales bacterium]
MEQIDLFYRFGVALAIGFLVGLQREYAYRGAGREIFAGERTLALMGLVGCTAALVADRLDSPGAFLGIVFTVAALIIVAYFVGAWRRGEVGLTSETAALVTILTGALCYWGYITLALAIGVITIVLLSLKVETDTFVRRITREDVRATLQFAVITAIVLPLLPNRAFGPPPLDVLNPRKVWLMVVLISGISFLGYVLIKVVGTHQGIGLTGLLGGLVSSTGVTLSFTQRSRERRGLAKPFALAIMVAWTVMFLRVMIEVAALNLDLLRLVWPPMTAAAAVGLGYCAYLYLSQRTDEEGAIAFSNPFELWPAVKFGLIYAAILLVSRTAQIYLGNPGVYLSSIVAGFADVDAITLSLAELSRAADGVDLVTAERAIVLATMSNTLVKGGVVLTGGSTGLRRALLPGLLLVLIGGIGVAFL